MISSVLVVCVGNVCRSPVGERLLAMACPDIRVESAGLGALVGRSADTMASEIAAEHGVDVNKHIARQFSEELASEFDLILVMEKRHLKTISEQTPQLSGKSMLFGHWMDQMEIPDPYRHSREFHLSAFVMLQKASLAWSAKLTGTVNV